MTTPPLKLNLCCVAHEVAMSYIDESLFEQLNNQQSFQEIEHLVGQWDKQTNIYHGLLINPDLAAFMLNEENVFYFGDIDSRVPVYHQMQLNNNPAEEALELIEEITPIKSSKEHLLRSLKDVPYYPKQPESRYILVFIKSADVLMEGCTFNSTQYNPKKMILAQKSSFQTRMQIISDIIMDIGKPKFNFLVSLIYDGEQISIDKTVHENYPFAFDMWIYDTQHEKTVYTANFKGDSSLTERLGIATDKPIGFIDKYLERKIGSSELS